MNGCVKENYKYNYDDLAPVPKGNIEVAKELERLCLNGNKCKYLNNWLNELYIFNEEYEIYRKN